MRVGSTKVSAVQAGPDAEHPERCPERRFPGPESPFAHRAHNQGTWRSPEPRPARAHRGLSHRGRRSPQRLHVIALGRQAMDPRPAPARSPARSGDDPRLMRSRSARNRVSGKRPPWPRYPQHARQSPGSSAENVCAFTGGDEPTKLADSISVKSKSARSLVNGNIRHSSQLVGSRPKHSEIPTHRDRQNVYSQYRKMKH